MATNPGYSDDLLLLLVTFLVTDQADFDWGELTPFLDQLLRTLEKRSRENTDAFSSLPFPPDVLFRRLRSSVRLRRPFGRDRRHMQQEISDSIYGRLSERLDRIESDIDRQLKEVHRRLDDISIQGETKRTAILQFLTTISDDLNGFEWALSIGTEPADLHTQRSIPVRIYLSEPVGDEIHQQIIDAVASTLEELSFEKDTDLPEESGSWWKRFWMRTKDAATQEEVTERLGKLERAAEVALLDKPQAEANKDHAIAIAALMEPLKKTDNACIQVGNILLVKIGGDIIARTLTPIELRAMEKNQSLLKQPQELLGKLQAICEADEQPETNSDHHEISTKNPRKPNTKRKKNIEI